METVLSRGSSAANAVHFAPHTHQPNRFTVGPYSVGPQTGSPVEIVVPATLFRQADALVQDHPPLRTASYVQGL